VSDVALIAVLLVAFALAIGLVRLLGRLIESDAPDGWVEEPPDTTGSAGPGRSAVDGSR